MSPCLDQICQSFEGLKGFLQNTTPKQEMLVDRLFGEFMECFASLKEEKLNYPKEFRDDVRLYQEGFEPLVRKFDDREIRYLILSDFYDFARLNRLYIRK